MTRLAPFGAGRNDHLHGDEDQRELTAAQEDEIETRAAELLKERLADRDQFDDLLAGMEPDTINHKLHRALMSLDNACAGPDVRMTAYLLLTVFVMLGLAVNWKIIEAGDDVRRSQGVER